MFEILSEKVNEKMDTKPKIILETEIPMYEIKHEIDMIKKRDTELNFRAQKTEEFLNTFITLEESKLVELSEKLKKLNIPRLRDAYVYKIVDILPTTAEEVKLVLQGYTITVSMENMKKIADIVKKYIPDKIVKKEKSKEVSEE
jgi:DNA-directed RNA polymerase subunit F